MWRTTLTMTARFGKRAAGSGTRVRHCRRTQIRSVADGQSAAFKSIRSAVALYSLVNRRWLYDLGGGDSVFFAAECKATFSCDIAGRTPCGRGLDCAVVFARHLFS